MVHTGVGSHVRILDMGLILDDVLETLPALHVISGCDSVSAVNGKGKAKWLSTAQKKEKCLQSVSQLGDTIRISADVFQKMKNCFVISMECQMKQM